MLVPSAYNALHVRLCSPEHGGLGQPRRAKRALGYGILTAFAAGLVMAWLAFFHGDALSLLFAKDAAVAAASHSFSGLRHRLHANPLPVLLHGGTTTAVRRPSLS